jgi:hypothetical protein
MRFQFLFLFFISSFSPDYAGVFIVYLGVILVAVGFQCN